MNTPTSGKGAVDKNSQNIVGVDHWNVDARDYIKILTSYHQLSLDQVHALYGWFMGNKTYTLTKFTNMKLNDIDPNKAGNLGLVN